MYPQEKLLEFEIACRGILKEDPDNVEVLSTLGQLLTEWDQMEEAGSLLYRALALGPDSSSVRNNLGIYLSAQDNLPDAEEHYRVGIELAPDKAFIYINLGTCLCLQKKTGAGEFYLKALELEPENALFHYFLGSYRLEQGRASEAETSLREAVRLNPEESSFHNNLAVALHEQGKTGFEIGKAFRQAKNLDPENETANQNYEGFKTDSTLEGDSGMR